MRQCRSATREQKTAPNLGIGQAQNLVALGADFFRDSGARIGVGQVAGRRTSPGIHRSDQIIDRVQGRFADLKKVVALIGIGLVLIDLHQLSVELHHFGIGGGRVMQMVQFAAGRYFLVCLLQPLIKQVQVVDQNPVA
jgi:hypothetical protein